MKTALESLDALEALARRVATWSIYSYMPDDLQETIHQAKGLVAELPEPVDPDLIEARNICTNFKSAARIKDEILAGERDGDESIRAIVMAIKRGRELAREEGVR